MLRMPSPLDDELEALVHRVIGYCIRVHRELGPGLLERIYRRAVCIELQSEGVPFEVEKSFPVWCRGNLLCDVVFVGQVRGFVCLAQVTEIGVPSGNWSFLSCFRVFVAIVFMFS